MARRRRAARRRLTVIVLTLALTVAAAVVAWASGALSASSDVRHPNAAGAATTAVAFTDPATTATAAPATTATAAPTTTTVAGDGTGSSHAVGFTEMTFVDSSRPTSPNGSFGGAPDRTLPTMIWYPAVGAAGQGAVDGAALDRSGRPYPMVVFAHGYAVTPAFYEPLLERWAAAGYVVVAPVYPILSGSPGGSSHVDYVETFADTSFVITQMLALSSDSPLAGSVDPTRIAMTGHSDGEVIAFALGFLDCCVDPRVRSVIAMAGDLSNANNPHRRNSGIPILHIMSERDEYDPYEDSIAWDDAHLDPPRWSLTLVNAAHATPFTGQDAARFELVVRTTIDFLDGTLRGRADRLTDIAGTVDANPGQLRLSRRGSPRRVPVLRLQHSARRSEVGLAHRISFDDRELDPSRSLERREPRPHPRAQVVSRRRGVVFGPVEGHDSAHDLAPLRVGDADHDRVADLRMLLQHLFDLFGPDLLATRIDAP